MPTSLSALLACLGTLFFGLIMTRVPTMHLGMSRNRQRHKIPWPIIVPDPIDVVNMFIWLKTATIGLFPDHTMLGNVAFAIGPWIIRHKQKYMSALVDAATFPEMVCRATLASWIMAVKVEFCLPLSGISRRAIRSFLWDRFIAPTSTASIWRDFNQAFHGVSLLSGISILHCHVDDKKRSL